LDDVLVDSHEKAIDYDDSSIKNLISFSLEILLFFEDLISAQKNYGNLVR
jgi:hypothetical protein